MSVQKMIADFEAKSGQGAFPKISRKTVAAGLKARVGGPHTIKQGRSSLCGPAALLFIVLSRDAEAYVKYVTKLYDDGKAALCNMWVTPGADCRDSDPAGDPPEVDWVSLAALRDSENDFTDYQDPSDKVAGITSPSILSVWLKRCGFGDRKNETNVFFTKDKDNLIKASDLHRKGHVVCLLCKGDTLKKIKGGITATPSHWVVMTRPASFSKGSVALQVFSWGELHDLNMSEDIFFSTYFGFVSGKH